jgi:hypothetical protein
LRARRDARGMLLRAKASRTSRDFALELEADALAAPQGRAEDVSIKGVFRLSDRIRPGLPSEPESHAHRWQQRDGGGRLQEKARLVGR